jgi:hypothetical protein
MLWDLNKTSLVLTKKKCRKTFPKKESLKTFYEHHNDEERKFDQKEIDTNAGQEIIV